MMGKDGIGSRRVGGRERKEGGRGRREPSSEKMRPLIDGDRGGIPAVGGGRGRCRMEERKGTNMSLKVKSPDLLFVIFLLRESTGKKATEKMKRIAKSSNDWSPDKTQE